MMEVRTWKEVPKRTKNSVTSQVNKLVKKYGEREVRFVVRKMFENLSKKRQLEEQIKNREKELKELKRRK